MTLPASNLTTTDQNTDRSTIPAPAVTYPPVAAGRRDRLVELHVLAEHGDLAATSVASRWLAIDPAAHDAWLEVDRVCHDVRATDVSCVSRAVRPG